MSGPAKDPLAFDFDLGFKSSAERVVGERIERLRLGARALPYNHAFLDDYLRCIMPNDLVILGAETGAGKTELARWIAASNALSGKRVYYLALEAEPQEIERRNKYSIIAELVTKHRVQVPGGLNYIDWYRGAIERYLGEIDAEANELFDARYKSLFTYYRGSKFDHDDIRKLFLAVQDDADLIVLDHLHYVDVDDDNENRGFKNLIKTIRDASISIGKPVILVAHLRKPDRRIKALLPSIHDFHGSSDITKIATDAIILAPAWSMPTSREGVATTFFGIPKAREAGGTKLVALCEFDWRKKLYADHYTLGREHKPGEFEPLGTVDVPGWAHRHQPLPVSIADAQGARA